MKPMDEYLRERRELSESLQQLDAFDSKLKSTVRPLLGRLPVQMWQGSAESRCKCGQG